MAGYAFAEYLEIEEASEERHEYRDGELSELSRGEPERAAFCARLIARLAGFERGERCRTYESQLRIRVLATGLATYAAASVICGRPVIDPESSTHVTNPAIIFEVIIPGMESHYRGVKREHYQRIDSLSEYVILDYDRPYAEKWTRNADGAWEHEVIEGDGEVVLQSVGGSIALRDLFYNFSTTSPNTYAS